MQLSQQSQSELDIAESLGAILRVKQPYMGSEAQSSYACSKPSTSTMTFAVEPYMNFSRSSCHVASEIASLLPSLQSIPSWSMNLPTSCFATEILERPESRTCGRVLVARSRTFGSLAHTSRCVRYVIPFALQSNNALAQMHSVGPAVSVAIPQLVLFCVALFLFTAVRWH